MISVLRIGICLNSLIEFTAEYLLNRYAVKFLLCDIIVLQNFKPYGLTVDLS